MAKRRFGEILEELTACRHLRWLKISCEGPGFEHWGKWASPRPSNCNLAFQRVAVMWTWKQSLPNRRFWTWSTRAHLHCVATRMRRSQGHTSLILNEGRVALCVTHLFLHTFIHLFAHSFFYSYIHLFIHTFILLFTHFYFFRTFIDVFTSSSSVRAIRCTTVDSPCQLFQATHTRMRYFGACY